MHEESYKDRKNQIKHQKSISSTIGTLPHPKEAIFWNECLMRIETRVRRMRTGDAHRQEGKSINHMLQQLTIFNPIRFSFLSTTSKKLKFLFSFDCFKSMKLRAMRSQMTKSTTIVLKQCVQVHQAFWEEIQQHGFVLSSTYDIEVLYDQSHYNGVKLEQTQIRPKPQVET